MNVRGLNNKLKRRTLFNKIRKEKYDFYFLQEIYATDETLLLWEKEWGGSIYSSTFTTKQRGVAILCNRNSEYVLKEVKKDCLGRKIMIHVTVDDADYMLCSIYAPNHDSPLFFQELADWISQSNCEHVIVGGDYNLVLNESLDSRNRITNNVKAKEKLLSIMDEIGLVDAWRLKNPEARIYTRCRRRPTVCLSRIDMFLINNGLAQTIKNCTIEIATESDHSKLGLLLEADEVQRGPGNWRFNNNMLNDKLFQVIYCRNWIGGQVYMIMCKIPLKDGK